jgi:tripartite-type tricarboxylate transporter receptor subunit TctC
MQAQKTRRQVLGQALAGTAALGASALIGKPAIAQAWSPTKTIRIIVPFPAGATTDMLARLFAQRMTETLGQTVLVENVGGAGGALGADQVAKAAPDGHTLLFHNITFTTTTTTNQLAKKSRHDIEADFVPISVGAYVPFWLLAHPGVPANDLKEFVAWAKKTKDKVNYGSTGPGSIMNLCGEVIKRDGGIEMQHVPFRGAAPLVAEMLSGRIQFGGDQLSSSLQHVRSGALKAMAVATPSAAMPNVPTVRSLGLSCRAGTASWRPRGPRRPWLPACTGRSRRPASIRTCASGWPTSAPSRPVRRRTKCGRCSRTRSPRSGRSSPTSN